MAKRVIILLSLILLWSCKESGQPAAAVVSKVDNTAIEKAAKHIMAKGILNGTKVLSADNMEGRAAGTEGEKKAADYIAGRFAEIGLKPLGDSFFQYVELVGFRKSPESGSTSIQGEDGPLKVVAEENFTWWSTSQKEQIAIENAPLLFVGYGVEAPEHDWDDFKGVDCNGKILVFLNNDPQTGNRKEFGGLARTYYGRYHYKFEQAMRKGALGGIMIHTKDSAGYGWQVIGKKGLRESFALKLPGAGYQVDFLAWMREDLAGQLAHSVGDTLEGWFEKGNRRDFQPIPLPLTLTSAMKVDIRETKAINVVGTLEGADPELKREHLVFTAHYDHLGTVDSEEDTIYNGAWDNALGTACITSIASAFTKLKPKPLRSLTFVACTAEERGLLGSQWFVAKPPIQRKQIVGNINIDMPQMLGKTSDMVAIGHDTNSMGAALIALGKEEGVTIKGDQNPNAGSFYRSDQVNFAKAGIPALYMLPGKDYLEGGPTADPKEYHEQHYHQLKDEVNEKWNLSGCERDMRLIFKLAARLANAPSMPKWNSGNEFEGAWKKLHGKASAQ